MLDNTNEITDIKKELQSYSVYGYDTDAEFDDAIEYAIDIAMRERMYPALCSNAVDNATNASGAGVYDYYKALGKSGMDDTEINVYYAEVYFAVAEFLLLRDRLDKAARLGYTQTKSEGGVSTTISGYSGKDAVVKEYISKGNYCLGLAGYSSQNYIRPRCSIHG